MYFSAINVAFINSPIWDDCVEVSDEVHNEIIVKLQEGYILAVGPGGGPIVLDPIPHEELSINQLFAFKINDLNEAYEQSFSILHETYPFSETTTWPVQVTEAYAYDAWRTNGAVSPAPQTPFLTDLSLQRDLRDVGAGLEDLVDRVLNNNAIFSPAVAALTAIRHKAEKDMTIAKLSNDYASLRDYTYTFDVELAETPSLVTPPVTDR